MSVRVVRTSGITPDVICPDAVECEIMGVCDISDYLERQHKRERCAELKKQMTERAKKYQEEEFWRHIAGSDPAMAELFKEFEELTK